MDYSILCAHVAAATGAHENTLYKWLDAVPRIVRREYLSRLNVHRGDEVIVAIREKRRGGLSGAVLKTIVAAFPEDDPTQHIEDADARAAALHSVLTDEERVRFAAVTNSASRAATEALWGRGHLYNLGRCLGLLILRPAVLAYVLTGGLLGGLI